MKFTILGQKEYKDDNGNSISAEKIEFIAPYKHIVDGFYEWECGQCGNKHGCRSCGWPIAGQVLRCEKCGFMNLLVKTNTAELDKWFGKNIELEKREQDIVAKEKVLANYIPKERWNEMVKILKKVSEFNQTFSVEIGNCIQGLNVD